MGKQIFKSVFFIFFLFSACVSDQKPKENIADTPDSTKTKDTVTPSHITYKLPSPIETFLFIKSNGGIYNDELLNPPDNYEYYFSSINKALNFGIYSSDMVYATINGDFERTIKLFGVSKNLSDDLGIHGGFSQTVANRIDKNLYNIDSLHKLTNDSYWESCKYLEQEGMADVLAPILCGGFIETTYILGQTIDDFENQKELVQRFIDQGIILYNLVEYLEGLENDDFKDLIKLLLKIQDDYVEILEKEDDSAITKNQFEKLLNSINKVRDKIISI